MKRYEIALSQDGNPEMETVSTMLAALGLRFAIAPVQQ
jgi:DNA-binding phage protein